MTKQLEKKLRELLQTSEGLKTKNSDLQRSLEQEVCKRDETEKKRKILERLNQQLSVRSPEDV